MKKMIPMGWIIMICILIVSCKQKENKPDNSQNQDTTSSNKKEDKPTLNNNPELVLGYLQVGLKVNGTVVPTDSAKITIRPKTDFSAIQIFCFKNAQGNRGQLNLKSSWHGAGDYDNVSAEWNDPTGYTSDYKYPGKMKITSWEPGRIDGTFSVTVINRQSVEYTPDKKLIEGEFHWLKER